MGSSAASFDKTKGPLKRAFIFNQSSFNLSRCQKSSKVSSAFRRSQLPKSFSLNLANPLASDVKLLADFFQRVFPLAADAKP
jgi:hypothetical protein